MNDFKSHKLINPLSFLAKLTVPEKEKLKFQGVLGHVRCS
jgi:hypothetical protein